jgi:regulator of protease activity HflC (stomatin/prohibitin superfamily)
MIMNTETKFWVKVGSSVLVGGVVVIGSVMWIIPQYRVWSARMEGEAELAQAEGNRQIAVQEAQAKKESASLLAEAEIERARGVAEANKIIGDSLRNNDSYLRWLWIDRLDKGNNSVIYIPTEGGLPILEAGKR